LRVPRHRRTSRAAELLAAGHAQLDPDVTVNELVRASASVARGLTELAEQQHADLVIVGASGPGASPGRTAVRLLQGAPCAVSISAAGRRDTGVFHHVGIAYDGSHESTAALRTAYALAARDGAAVTLYHAFAGAAVAQSGGSARELERAALAPRLEAQELLDTAADDAPPGVNPRTVLLHGDPGPKIGAAADGVLDILFAGSRGYGPMHRALAGSVSESLLRSSTQPVVVMPRAGVAGLGRPGEDP
jgi:nucleotide-binding universal stress UspA family protein